MCPRSMLIVTLLIVMFAYTSFGAPAPIPNPQWATYGYPYSYYSSYYYPAYGYVYSSPYVIY